MSDDSNDERWTTFTDGFIVPIAGLLALIFALMAGMSVLPALSGSPQDMVTLLIFVAAALLSFHVRRRAVAARSDD